MPVLVCEPVKGALLAVQPRERGGEAAWRDVGEKIKIAMLMLRRYLQVPYQLLQQPHFGSTYMYPCRLNLQGRRCYRSSLCSVLPAMAWDGIGNCRYLAVLVPCRE